MSQAAEQVVFRANYARLQITVPGTMKVIRSLTHGERVLPNKVIKFERGRFVASTAVKYQLMSEYVNEDGTQNFQVVNQVEFLRGTEHFNGGCGGARIWEERGNEDVNATLERLLTPVGPNEQPPDPKVVMAVAKAAALADEAAKKKPGPPVHQGLRQSLLPQDAPDPIEGDYINLIESQTAGCVNAKETSAVQESFRSVVQSE